MTSFARFLRPKRVAIGIAAFSAALAVNASAVGISSQVGVVSPGTNVTAFVVAADSTLQRRYWTGSTWLWEAHGTPGVAITGGVGATTWRTGSSRWPMAYVLSGTSVYLRDYGLTTASAWTWTAVGTLASITSPVGGVSGYSSGYAYPSAWLIGSAGASTNLYQMRRVGTSWATFDHGTPSGVTLTKGVGTLAVGQGYQANSELVYAFVIGNDGNLHSRWDTGSGYTWTNHGAPGGGVTVNDPMGVVNSNGRPFVFVTGSDGNLWSRSWSGSAWGWYNHGTPTGLSITSAVGTTCGSTSCQQPFQFVKASDGNLWSQSWNGSSWVWTNHGLPPGGVTIVSGMGAAAVSDQRPYAYFLGSDGNLWLRWWSGSAWGWYNNGTP